MPVPSTIAMVVQPNPRPASGPVKPTTNVSSVKSLVNQKGP